MEETIKLYKQEEKEINDQLKQGSLNDFRKYNKDRSLVDGLIEKFNSLIEVVKGYKPPENIIHLPKELEVKGSVSILNKIEALVKFPTLQQIFGRVIVENLPEVQKVKGKVDAHVIFPKVQKVEGQVDVQFPKVQQVELDMADVVKAINEAKLQLSEGEEANKSKANPTKYLPVRLTNGKMFYDAIGGLTGMIKKQTAALETTVPLFYSGQRRITASGSALALPPADTSSVLVQALKDNRALVYITAGSTNDFELQAGQSVSIDVDRSEKVKIIGSIVNDGVSYIFS